MAKKHNKRYKKYIPFCTCGNRMQKRQTLKENQKRYFCSQCGHELD